MERRASQTVPLLIWLLALHLVGLLIFTKGFLLTRVELELYSTCSDFSLQGQSIERTTNAPACRVGRQLYQSASSGEPTAKGPSVQGSCNDGSLEESNKVVKDKSGETSQKGSRKSECWTTPKVHKVVIVIIDAMRFDFAANVSDYHQPRGAWVGRLPIFERLVAEEEASAALFKFVADPPTTSLQRLKGLTTGGLPTFIDIGNSFGAPAITEDNIISQIAQQGRRLVLLGDDTWMDLYPTQFTEAHPYPSFVVKDIHTVDNGVIKEIFPALERDDWDVLIGHFLGVDHVGHTYDVGSQVMLDKLDQMNAVLEDIVAALQAHSEGLHKDTLLIVMGDHAQTLSGDHGGGTPEETDTALFALSMRPPPAPLPSDLRSPSCSSPPSGEGPLRCSRLPQVDFAPTLAMLLGVPIPYASVGKISPELWALCSNTWAQSSSTLTNDSTGRPCQEINCQNASYEESGSTFNVREGCSSSGQFRTFAKNGRFGNIGKSQGPDFQGAEYEGSQREEVSEAAAKVDGEGDRHAENQASLGRWMEGYLAALQVNSAQVQRYLDRYSAAASSPFPAAALGKVRALHRKAVATGDELRRTDARALLEGEGGADLGKGKKNSSWEKQGSRKELECESDKEEVGGREEESRRQVGPAQTREAATCGPTPGEGCSNRQEEGGGGRGSLRRAIAAHTEHLAAAAELARAQWTQFDGAAMVLGLTVLVASLIGHFAALVSLSSPSPLPWMRMLTSAAFSGAVFGLAAYSVPPAVEERTSHFLVRALRSGAGTKVNALVVGCGAAALASMAVLIRHVLRGHMPFMLTSAADTTAARSRTKDWGVLLFTCVRAATLISDNCIIAEGKIAIALTALSAALYLRDAIVAKNKAHIRDALLIIAANANLAYLGLQSVPSEKAGQSGDGFAPPLTTVAVALSTSVPLLLLFPLLLRHLPSEPRVWRGFRTCCALQYALVGGYRLAEDLGDQFLPPPFLRHARTLAPRAVYGLAAVLGLGLVVSVFDVRLCKRLQRISHTPAVRPNDLNSSAPEEQVAQVDHPGLGDLEESSLDRMVARATSARVVAMVTVLAGVLVMLLGRKGPAVLVAAAVQLACSIRLQSLYGELASSTPKGDPARAKGTGRFSVPAVTGSDASRKETERSDRGCAKAEISGSGPTVSKGSGRSSEQSPGPEAEDDSSGCPSDKVASTGARTYSVGSSTCDPSGGSSNGLVRLTALGAEWSLYTTHLFFCTGHRCAFDALQYTAAFVGFEGFSFVRSGTLLAANTFAAQILVAFALPLSVCHSATNGQSTRNLRLQVGRVLLAYGLACTLAFMVTVGTVSLLRRHLMVWSIFAPKFVFDSCSLLVTDVLLVSVALYVEAAYGKHQNRTQLQDRCCTH